MNKRIIIDASRGGEDIGGNNNGIIEKDYNLKMSNYINKRLKELNIPSSTTREKDDTISIKQRLYKIHSNYGEENDVIIISNALSRKNNGIEIIYAIRNNKTLPEKIIEEIKKLGITNTKIYKKSLPTNPNKDFHQLIRDSKNNESIIIYYGNINNSKEANRLKNTLEELGESVVKGITNYLGVEYINKNIEEFEYTVQKGDSLYSIAKKYNQSVNDIKKINNLTSNLLQIGQKINLLKIVPEETELYYKVQKGDNLYNIAKKYSKDINDIKKLNHLDNNNLTIGMILEIPNE